MKTGLVWFRNNLRLDDNPALNDALSENDRVILVYIYDKRLFTEKQFGNERMGGHRIRFLFQSVENLADNLSSNDLHLHTAYDNPVSSIIKLASKYNVNTIYNQHEIGTEESDDEFLIASNFNVVSYETSTLIKEYNLGFHLDDLPQTFTSFRKLVEKKSKISKPVDFKRGKALSIEIPDKVYLNEFAYRILNQHKNSAFNSTGGETMAFSRLKEYIWDAQLIKTYKKTRNNLIGSSYSSKFSPWLANGCISPRRLYSEILKFEETILNNESTYWMRFELLWREFFKWVGELNQEKLFIKKGFLDATPNINHHNENFKSWASGNTNNQFVNANMNELNKTGFMSNRGRQIVASFLIYDLKVDWRFGASYFEKQLIDFDCSSNYGNWTYIAGVGNDPRGGRHFDVNKQAKLHDPDNDFTELWSN